MKSSPWLETAGLLLGPKSVASWEAAAEGSPQQEPGQGLPSSSYLLPQAVGKGGCAPSGKKVYEWKWHWLNFS